MAKRRYHFRQWSMKINTIQRTMLQTMILNSIHPRPISRFYTHSKSFLQTNRKYAEHHEKFVFMYFFFYFFFYLIFFCFISIHFKFYKATKNRHSQNHRRGCGKKSPGKKLLPPKRQEREPQTKFASSMYCHEI